MNSLSYDVRAPIRLFVLFALSIAAATACGSSTSSADGSPEDSAAGVGYRARAVLGGIDRILVTKADSTRDVCVVIKLVNVDVLGVLQMSTPANWGGEAAQHAKGAARCDEPRTVAGVDAASGSGSITWTPSGNGTIPTTLSIAANLEFSGGVDAEELNATDVSVTQ